jgi:hypothetical protein
MTLEGGGGGGILSGIGDAVGSVFKGVEEGVKGIVQPVYDATLKQIPGVDNALVNLDKSVGKAIPGGWGTIASTAAAFIPGMQPLAMAGIGALNGSGVMRGDHKFNLQGAIMGGALAYGASNLAQGLEAAGGGGTATDQLVAKNIASNLGVEGASFAPGSQAAMLAEQAKGFGEAGLNSIKEGANQAIQSNLASAGANAAATAGTNAAGADVYSGLAGTQGAIPPTAIPQPTGLQSLANSAGDYAKGTLSNMEAAGRGIQNLSGLGTGSAEAAKAFSGTGAGLTNTTLPILMGGTGLAAVDAQQKYQAESNAANDSSNAQIAAENARIEAEAEKAREMVAANPLQTSADISSVSPNSTLYDRNNSNDTLYSRNSSASNRLYAMGGSIVNPPDDQTGMPTQTPMENFEQGGLMSMIGRTAPQQMFAVGGIAEPRFLSGGGDGMSDSIHASIDGNQEARLADGEFVIPADVVSHLGNGSSKAGAKQLYSMMDKVRQARTGRKSQGKQINPRKFLNA